MIYILLTIFFIFFFFLVKNRTDPRLPPGIHGWPIIGHLPSGDRPVLEQVQAFREKYGDIFLWRTGSQTIVYLCNYQLIKTAFNNPYLINRPDPVFSMDSWTYFKKIGLINNNGATWQADRRFALRHLRDSGFGKSVVADIILQEAECLIKNFKNYVDKPTGAPWSINVAVLNVIWRLAADRRFDCGDKEIMEFGSSISEVFVLVQGKINILDVFPWITSLLPNFIMEKWGINKLQAIRKKLKSYLKSVIEEHRATFDPEHPRGYIDNYFIEMNKNSTTFNEEDLIICIGDLFFAGSDTTAAMLRWALLYLAKYPDVQEKIHSEITSVVPRDRLPYISDKERMPYTEAATYDLLRMVSLTNFGLFHAASQDTQIEGYFIPKGTVVLGFLYGCHREPSDWTTPDKFNPEHFLNPDGSFNSKKEGFIAFSTGRRICLGESLARTELFLFLSALIQNYSFHPPEGVTVEDLIVEKDPERYLFNICRPYEILIKERK